MVYLPKLLLPAASSAAIKIIDVATDNNDSGNPPHNRP
jgi:hypothetical protein